MLYLLMLMVPIMCFINIFFHMNSLLMTLLSLEALMLSIMFMVTSSMMLMEMNIPVVCVLILSISACEASLGLSLLVIMTRLYGSDVLNSLSLSKC
uniref:NADH-ubiquinone oxidoreductase chain 4L n=1 Tax=Haemopis sanguisuga TaxID=51991 RepID=A0A7L7S0E9_9ANNE|nr:NADH dehydrogenase subunit 4L [Haemopis sanguisuga]